jgi:formylglycine-generating enzyme
LRERICSAAFAFAIVTGAACHEGSPRGTADLTGAFASDAGSDSGPLREASPRTCHVGERLCVDGVRYQCNESATLVPLPCGSATERCVNGQCVPCTPRTRRCRYGAGGDEEIVCTDAGIETPPALCKSSTPTCLPDLGCVSHPSCTLGVLGADSCPIRGGAPSCCVALTASYSGYNRLNDPALSTSVGAFDIDRFEVTVGRFRRFVEDGRGTFARPPPDASGGNPRTIGTSWDPIWKASLPTDSPALRAGLASCPFSTWSDVPSAREYLPINCVTWFEAFSFCIWDGGRLPTEAEWNAAAAEGPNQRVYPWSSPANDPLIDATRAIYDCSQDGSPPGECGLLDLIEVGSRVPAGDTALGVSDLAGSVAEWTFDAFATPLPSSCVDCAVTSPVAARVTRGGSWKSPPSALRNDQRAPLAPSSRDDTVGFRCAR